MLINLCNPAFVLHDDFVVISIWMFYWPRSVIYPSPN